LHLTLYWQADHAVSTDYSVFLHLLDSDGRIVAQEDGPPQNGFSPTSWWRPPEMIADPRKLEIPIDLAAGRYVLELGVYDSANGSRLSMTDATGRIVSIDSWKLQIDIDP
jgi:hypothetical protein